MTYLDADRAAALVSADEAVAVLERSLADGTVDPENDSPRLFSPATGGEFLLMPTSGSGYCGVKVLTMAPDNPRLGLPKIQGVYVLFESAHLAPLAMMDAAELTLIRTPATTSLAVQHLLAAGPTGRNDVERLVVIGTGPQAERHLQSLWETVAPNEVMVLGRRSEAAAALADRCRGLGINARAGRLADLPAADVIICATSSATPVLSDELVGPDAVVCAIGSHGLDRREVPAALVRRCDVVVEGRASALREAGDLIPARSAREWNEMGLANLAELVTGRFRRRAGHPAFFCGVGMAWQDLTVAAHIYTAHLASQR